jgi:hypothetical protein
MVRGGWLAQAARRVARPNVCFRFGSFAALAAIADADGINREALSTASRRWRAALLRPLEQVGGRRSSKPCALSPRPAAPVRPPVIGLLAPCYSPCSFADAAHEGLVRIDWKCSGSCRQRGPDSRAARFFSLFRAKMTSGSSPSSPCADGIATPSQAIESATRGGGRRPRRHSPYPIASSSPIIRSITERPMLQKAGSRASRPKGFRSSS